MDDYVDYRLALILPRNRQLLAIVARGVGSLPSMGVPRWSRPVAHLTHRIKEKWNIQTIVLDVLPSNSPSGPCAIIEVLTPAWRFADEGFTPVDPYHIDAASLGDAERLRLISIFRDDETLPPFSRIGWVEEAKLWIQASVCDHAVVFNEEIVQFNACGSFALVRFGARRGPAYWLKAAGVPNSHEFAITQTLSEHFQQHLPHLVAMREDWTAWVMEDAGLSLHNFITLPHLEQATISLAELQIGSTEHLEELLSAGCGNQMLGYLDSELDELIEYLDEAMRRQISTKVSPLGNRRLAEMRGILHAACAKMEDLAIPNSLTHNDINPENILWDGCRCLFIDWSEACVGNPFLTFQLLSVHVGRLSGVTPAWASRLNAVYRQRWLGRIQEAKIDCALALVPLLAIASHLYGRGTWLRSPRRADPDLQSYARSLARHMDREARSPQLLEALCQ